MPITFITKIIKSHYKCILIEQILSASVRKFWHSGVSLILAHGRFVNRSCGKYSTIILFIRNVKRRARHIYNCVMNVSDTRMQVK